MFLHQRGGALDASSALSQRHGASSGLPCLTQRARWISTGREGEGRAGNQSPAPALGPAPAVARQGRWQANR